MVMKRNVENVVYPPNGVRRRNGGYKVALSSLGQAKRRGLIRKNAVTCAASFTRHGSPLRGHQLHF